MSINDWTEWTTEELLDQLGERIVNSDDEVARGEIATELASRGVSVDEIEAATR